MPPKPAACRARRSSRKSTDVLNASCRAALAGELPIIGVGGIMGGEDAAEKIKAGASLVQFYSGFIYRGPDLVSEVAETLAIMLRQKNVKPHPARGCSLLSEAR